MQKLVSDIKLLAAATLNAAAALAEDLNTSENIPNADISAQLIPAAATSKASLVCREQAILCGRDWFNAVYELVDPLIKIDWLKIDGAQCKADETICYLEGNTRSLLTAERSALNLLQTLSGTASTTAEYVNQLGKTKTKILDTRKTIPGLRLAQKYAVWTGGGTNHRHGLYDAILIKENHIMGAGSIKAAIQTGRNKFPDKFLEIEVENIEELAEVIELGVDRVLLDNFSIDLIKQAVSLVNNEFETELSGNVTAENLEQLGQLGVDYISIGAITKHIRAIDFSMRIMS